MAFFHLFFAMIKLFSSSPKSRFSTRRAARQRRHQPKPIPLIYPMILALMAGLTFGFALAPYHLWVLAITSPMILYIILVSEENSRRAFWVGEAYGFGVWIFGAFWLYHSIYHYGNIPFVLAILMIIAMAIIMGLFHAFMAWSFVKFLGRQPLAFAGLWIIQESAKTWVLTGFPWLFVGYAFTEVPLMTSFAPITGVFGISFLAVLLGASLVEIFRKKYTYFAISSALLMVGAALWFINPSWTTKTKETLSVSLVQGNIPQDLKWQEQYLLDTLAIYDDLSQNEWGQDIVLWPEAAIPLFQDEAEDYINALKNKANHAGSAWIFGILYRDTQNFNPKTQVYPKAYNSVMVEGQDAKGLYFKQNLVPFGEYIPFSGLLDLLPDLAGANLVSLSKGETKQDLLTVKNKKIGAAICYEVAYPDTTRRNAKDSELLLTISNDAWFGTTNGPHQHLQMVQMRSLETGRWFIRATNNGITVLIDEKGKIIKQAPQFERTVLRGTVPTFTGNTPFMYVGSMPILLICAILIWLSYIAKKYSGQSSANQLIYTADGVQD